MWKTIALIVGFLLCAAVAQAQPRAFLQFGTTNGVENRMSVTRVPVADSTGTIRYYDVSLVFNVDNAGRLTLNTTATKVTLSPTIAVGAFRPGIYEGGPFPCEHVVGAPGITGGRISGSIQNSNCSVLFNASWVSGPIAGHPNEGALRAAGISFQGYSWGILGDIGGDWLDLGWRTGDLIGVIQSGQQLVFHDFGDDSKEDRNAVFTLCNSCS